MSLQLQMLKSSDGEFPKFNNDFLLNWRRKVFDEIPYTMEQMIKEAMVLLEPFGYKYEGFRKLTPEETIQYYAKRMKGTDPSTFFEVHNNTLTVGEFQFTHGKSIIVSKVYFPFLDNHKIHYAGVDYYPDLPISEKCICANNQTGLLTIKVNRAPLMFWRSIQHPFVEVTNKKMFKEVVVTTKLHFGAKTAKKGNITPLVLYFLTRGFDYTLKVLGLKHDEISVVDYCDVDDTSKYYYFEIPVYSKGIIINNVYIRAKQKSMDENVHLRRFVASLLFMFDDFKYPYTIKDIYDPEATLWHHILGTMVYINKSLINESTMVIEHAKEHCTVNNSLIDSLTRKSFQTIGVDIENFDHFLQIVHEHIHEWCVRYKPEDLYDKRINYVAMFGGFNYKLFNDIWKIIRGLKKNRNKQKPQGENRHLLEYLAAHKPTWFDVGGMFMRNPIIYNGFIGTLLVHRYLSASTSESAEGRKGSKHVQRTLLLAHPSQLSVTSINTVPSTSPIVSGSINPYIDVDESGAISVPQDLMEAVKNCFID